MPKTPDNCIVSSPAVPPNAPARVHRAPETSLSDSQAPASPEPTAELNPSWLTAAPMTQGGVPAPSIPKAAALLVSPCPPWNLRLTQPLAPPVSREASCVLTVEAAHGEVAHGRIFSSLITLVYELIRPN